MRLILAILLAGLAALPLNVGAQGTDEGWLEKYYPELAPRKPPPETTPDKPAAKPAPAAVAAEAPPDQPTLLLKRDDAGIEVAPAREDQARSTFSSELRFELVSSAFRWSSYVAQRADLPDYGKRGFHVAIGLGLRLYPKSAHGLVLDLTYFGDLDLDGPPRPFICILDCPPDLWLTTDFVLVHVGYAYRHVVAGPSDPGRLAWAFTPHASLGMGRAYTRAGSDTGIYDLVTGAHSPVVGARFGIDIDLHINRFFMGWTLRYEVLKHTQGPLRATQLLSFNVIPVFRIGVVLGAKVQEN